MPLKKGFKIQVNLLSLNDTFDYPLESLNIRLVSASRDLLIKDPSLRSSIELRDSEPARSAKVIVGKQFFLKSNLFLISISITKTTWDQLDL